ncbi:MAG: MFS transporter [bacterium]
MNAAPPEKNVRFPLSRSLLYCSGQFGGNLLNNIYIFWLVYFYAKGYRGHEPLMPIFWFGTIQIAGRVVDAIADPIVGYWSDRTKTRIGRRRPFLLFGAPALVLSFYFLWTPPFPPGSPLLFVYLPVVMGVFWFSFTVVMVPYLALFPEQVERSDHRVQLSTMMSMFLMLSYFTQAVAAPDIIQRRGFPAMALVFAAAGLVFLYATTFTVRERAASARTAESYSIAEALGWTFSNPAFLRYVAAALLLQFGFYALSASMPFIVTEIFAKPESFTKFLMMIMGAGIIVSYVVINILSRSVEKKKLYLASVLGLGCVMPFMLFLGRTQLPVSTVTAGMVFMLVLSLPVAGTQILPFAILADIIDYDEKVTGKRREAIYFSAQGFLQKLATALSGFMQGAVFGAFGHARTNPLGINLLGPIAGAIALVGFVIFLGYPIDEKTKDLRKTGSRFPVKDGGEREKKIH